MKLKDNKKYITFPIEGKSVAKIEYDGMPSLHFNCEGDCKLEIHGDMVVTEFNQSSCLHPQSTEAFVFLRSIFGLAVKSAKADHHGNLWLDFEDGKAMMIEDGPFEHWHFSLRGKNEQHFIYVHGGIGRTVYGGNL